MVLYGGDRTVRTMIIVHHMYGEFLQGRPKMSHEPVVSMRELEMESAELLPSRETLHVCHGGHPSHVSYSSTTITSQSGDGNGILNFLNGSNFLNGNTVNVLSNSGIIG